MRINWESWNAIEEDLVAKINEKNNRDTNSFGFEGELLEFPPSPIIETPFGNYNSGSSFRPSIRWDCWIGHTDFNVTSHVINVLNNMEGVESVIAMGRYTFCVGIKKQLFNSKDVRNRIQESLCSSRLTFDEIKEKLKEYQYWSLLIYNDGRTDFIYSNDDDQEFNTLKQRLEEKKNRHGGTIFSSK